MGEMGKKLLIFQLLLLTSCAEKVDLILYNAEVFTSNDSSQLATSFAVKDGVLADEPASPRGEVLTLEAGLWSSLWHFSGSL